MLQNLIFFAGIGQLLLILASLAIPRVLKWKEETSKLRPLTRQVFWTYAAYIWVTNLSFGLVSVLIPTSLLDGSSLAIAVTSFITIYWAARIGIQFFYFDRQDAPEGPMTAIAEVLLVGLFVLLTVTYGWAVLHNVGWLKLDIVS